ncbi:MAG: GNAT family N-acetyltransferase [Alphaproteobacteria bacterium]|nr:GNAT family N-acetyltransferase [Alphaproteobacteria bacterium]
MPPVSVRSYHQDDHDALVALYALAFPDDSPWNAPRRMITDKIAAQPDGLLVGLDDDGTLIASVKAGYDGHRGWINSLAVHPHHRGKGHGKVMMDHALALLNNMGAVKVNLQIRGGNTSLKKYYESLGFEEEPRISMGILTEKGRATIKE